MIAADLKVVGLGARRNSAPEDAGDEEANTGPQKLC